MTTEVAPSSGAVTPDERACVRALLDDLENRPMSQYRLLLGPAGEAEQRAERLGDEHLVNRARLVMTSALLRLGRFEEGGRLAHRLLGWAERYGVPLHLARTHRELGIFYRHVGDMSTALTHAVQCVALLDDDTAPLTRARHLLSLGTALEENGSQAEAQRRFEEGLAIATAIGDDEVVHYTLNNMAYTAYERGDRAAAEEHVAHLRAAQQRSGQPFSANDLDTIARVQMMSGRYDEVEETLRPVTEAGADDELDQEADAPAMCLLTLAEARRLAGRFAAAQETLDATMRMCDERGLQALRAQAREEQSLLYADTGRFREAYEEHRAFHAEATALHSAQREAKARALQAVFEATEARRASDHFREMAHRDALTGLYNRRYVNERLPALLHEATVRGTPLSLAIVDLDHFKRINDTLSHNTGDAVLQVVAEMLAQVATGPAIAARLGGEEFLLVFPGSGLAEAALRCERLRRRIRGHEWTPVTGGLGVTTSMGVTCVADGRSTTADLLAQADTNLYAAKRAGRDRVITDSRA